MAVSDTNLPNRSLAKYTVVTFPSLHLMYNVQQHSAYLGACLRVHRHAQNPPTRGDQTWLPGSYKRLSIDKVTRSMYMAVPCRNHWIGNLMTLKSKLSDKEQFCPCPWNVIRKQILPPALPLLHTIGVVMPSTVFRLGGIAAMHGYACLQMVYTLQFCVF